MRGRRPWFIAIFLGALVLIGGAQAEEAGTATSGTTSSSSSQTGLDKILCPNAGVLGAGMFTKTCWSAMFPVKIAGKTTVTKASARAPLDHGRGAVCRCGGNISEGKLPSIGTPVGYWQPTRLVELTRKPYCLPAMGGIKLSNASATLGGARQTGGNIGTTNIETSKNYSMYHFHYYVYPVFAMLQIANIPQCIADGYTSFDVALMGETFPNWYDDGLSVVLSPEVLLFAGPLGMAAMPPDCIKATSTSEGIDSLFWVAGCWGMMYPINGSIGANDSPVRTSSLLAARVLFMLGRIGMVRRTVGQDVLDNCAYQDMRILKKSQYKVQMLFPVNESGSSDVPKADPAPGAPAGSQAGSNTPKPNGQAAEIDPRKITGQNSCTHPIGSSTLRWGEWRTRPATGEDFVYLLWQWVDCCAGVIGG